MKKVIAIFAFVFVAGILAGGAYEWLSDSGAKSTGGKASSAAAEKAEPGAATSESAGEDETADKTASAGKEHRVTNPNKICATPGCGRAVFVTYKGKELCVKCYGEAKKRDTEHE